MESSTTTSSSNLTSAIVDVDMKDPSNSSNMITPTTSSNGKRRAIPPSSIPDFPSYNKVRSPPAQTSLSPSPTSSPSPSSPFTSPPRSVAGQMLHPVPMPLSPLGMDSGLAPLSSPWHTLAATSGAPTPSLEGPGKGSPHLGYPFERLNIGGSWSGANLVAESSRRRSLPGDVKSMAPPPPQLADQFARYRALAGHASANAKGKSRSTESPPPQKSPTPATSSESGPMRLHLPGQAKMPSPLGPSSSSKIIHPLPPRSLRPLLPLSTTLVLDLRPPSSFHSAHLPNSVSLPIPSTLLRRPAFTLSKLTQMLPAEARGSVAEWKEKRDIILLDADSTRLTADSIMTGLAGKFDREGFQGNMWYLQGGLAALNGVDLNLITENSGEATPDNAEEGLMVGKLGSLAFQQGSTGSNLQNRRKDGPRTPGTPIRKDPFSPTSSHTEKPPYNPAFTSPGFSSAASSSGKDSGSSSRGSHHHSYNIQPANPFFDNIRQNLELSHDGISERISLDLPDSVTSRASEFPSWIRKLVMLPPTEAADRLASEFYQVELQEQRRLQAVMDWHTRDSGRRLTFSIKAAVEALQSVADDVAGATNEDAHYFPFSISAGVERGSKNRYKNIWPYDFSRVKLDSPPDSDSDYINASYVQPKGTARKYIATQGPLDATFCDFWTLVWEQDVRVIVMLTKQYEGGLLKCGNYWSNANYGSIRVELESQYGGEDRKADDAPGFDFGSAFHDKDEAPSSDQENIHRVFTLRKKNGEARRIVQIQCTAWPDFDVPDSPDVLLNLLRDVNSATEELCNGDADDRAAQPPVLVHCSAGVGRTGSFIIVDAIVDFLRRERDSQQSFTTRSSRDTTDSLSPSPSSVVHFADSIPPPSSSVRDHRSRSNSGSASMLEPIKEDKMDLDPPAFSSSLPRKARRDSSDGAPRSRSFSDTPGRPKLRSGSQSRSYEENEKALRRDFGVVPVLTKSGDRHREPSPIHSLDGSSPVATVLEGMRVQRMSLVQSLRQYIFVHRAIIHAYLNMIDNDRLRGKSPSSLASDVGTNPSMSSTTTFAPKTESTTATSLTSASTADDTSMRSGVSTKGGAPPPPAAAGTGAPSDEEMEPHKRRASPTELTMSAENSPIGPGSRPVLGLTKRPSSKKMRASDSSLMGATPLDLSSQAKATATSTSTSTTGGAAKIAGTQNVFSVGALDTGDRGPTKAV
ncbi:hypothetical protein BD324DRAFT_652210 [Kockovaella imperatae]|uniref:protein-tyrosine-phosphatase n=1 Tax=Kockovaella imperatae TaxID=4999 RepID=A0A1Y1UCD5_9TREE|nr:hypothetical protein BD324DRAFT_652210 [Kockovaella imperatae]ORX35662.1 hypothetical protein BD324DRAFT_652210 [Kockovaella imperatae]